MRADHGAKLVCLIQDDPPLRYFVNRLHEAHGVALVVLEKPGRRRSRLGRALGMVKARGVGALARALVRRLAPGSRRAPERATLERLFRGSWQQLAPDIPLLVTESVNDDAVLRRLEREGPWLLLDHGTTLVREPVIKRASLALNLHWGLSPYYRGVHCTEWALLNWDPHNVGVTVHVLSDDIDGGAVIGQARATLAEDDTVHSINMQLTYLGTEIMVEAVRRLRAGHDLPATAQDFSRGLLVYRRHWSELLERHVAGLERGDALARMLDAPARQEPLPIVELH